MPTRNTTSAGDITSAEKWDTPPVAGDIANVRHAMTIGTGVTFPSVGNLAELNLNVSGGSAPSLTVTGTVSLNAVVVTGIQKLIDTAATDLVIGPAGNAVSGTELWAVGSGIASPTHILGNLTLTSSTHGLSVNGTKLIVDGNVSASGSGIYSGIFISGTNGTLQVGGSCVGVSAGSGTGVKLNTASAILTASSCSGTSLSGPGIYNSGTITGPGGSPAVCPCTGVSGTGRGIQSDGALNSGLIVGNCIGVTGPEGSSYGVVVAVDVGYGYIRGNVTGISGVNGVGIYLAGLFSIHGSILLTTNPRSASILITSKWNSANGTGAGTIAFTEGNTVQDGNGLECCPIANVAPAASVLKDVPRWTGATGVNVGTVETPPAGGNSIGLGI